MGETSADAHRLVRFGVYELDLHAGELRKSGARLNLQQQPLQLLSVLLERPGESVTRDELRKRLWPGGYLLYVKVIGSERLQLTKHVRDSQGRQHSRIGWARHRVDAVDARRGRNRPRVDAARECGGTRTEGPETRDPGTEALINQSESTPRRTRACRPVRRRDRRGPRVSRGAPSRLRPSAAGLRSSRRSPD